VACGLRDGGGWLELVEHDRCGLGLDGFLFMVHVLRFGSGADHRLDGPGRGTVMRHFSFAEPSSVLQLPLGMTTGALGRLLVATCCRRPALPSRRLGARRAAVPVSAVTTTADHDNPAAEAAAKLPSVCTLDPRIGRVFDGSGWPSR